jgi:hypothetical protein
MGFAARIRGAAARRARGPVLFASAALATLAMATSAGGGPTAPAAPATLAETGLYADFSRRTLAPGIVAFEPQYPLWSDGATKRRWISLPPGTAVDASDPDHWRFPPGTRFWKEFAFERPVETRMIELGADGRWSFAAYVWSADGSTATLAPPRGVRRVCESRPGTFYDVPAVADCRACHEGSPATVLGFSALQLSGDRDPLAPHAAPGTGVDLAALVASGAIVGLPAELVARPPRIAARTPRERAALGYLHGNCANCHNSGGPLADLGLSLTVTARGHAELLDTALDVPARFQPHGEPVSLRLVAGHPESSLLYRRVASRQPLLQMPPHSSRRVDEVATALLEAWIREDLAGTTPSTAAAIAAARPEEE